MFTEVGHPTTDVRCVEWTTTHKLRPHRIIERSVMASKHHKQLYQRKPIVHYWTSTLVTAFALYAVCSGPAVAASPATGDMSLLKMQRIKSYVDDTCTLDPHCQWTWDTVGQNVLRNVSVEEASAMMPDDYTFPPGNDAEKPGQRGELFLTTKFDFWHSHRCQNHRVSWRVKYSIIYFYQVEFSMKKKGEILVKTRTVFDLLRVIFVSCFVSQKNCLGLLK